MRCSGSFHTLAQTVPLAENPACAVRVVSSGSATAGPDEGAHHGSGGGTRVSHEGGGRGARSRGERRPPRHGRTEPEAPLRGARAWDRGGHRPHAAARSRGTTVVSTRRAAALAVLLSTLWLLAMCASALAHSRLVEPSPSAGE